MSPSFADLGVDATLVAALEHRGFIDAFPVQVATLPAALKGRDILAKAPTGSGKTLAFGIPVVERCQNASSRRPKALILTPTRELAGQIRDELKTLMPGRERRILAVYGGTRYGPADQQLARGIDILVACPGRLEDLLEQGALELSEVEIVVIDEADRMADMGFLPSVRRLLKASKSDAQVLLFSATFDKEIEKVTKEFQNAPAKFDLVGEEDESGDVSHLFWHVAREDRVATCAKAIDELGRAIVFCRTKHGADRLAKQLGAAGVSAVAIHGDRSQSQRERALRSFDNGEARALVATDVAARGIHIDSLPGVIHFDPPQDHTDYTHRSGRTGRAGLDGIVVSLVLPEQRKKVYAMQRALKLDEFVGDIEVLVPPVMPERTAKKAPMSKPEGERAPRGRERAAEPRRRETKRTDSAYAESRARAKERDTRHERRTEARQPTDRASESRRRPRSVSPSGRVKFYDPTRGYGFVERSGEDDLFVHFSGLVGAPNAVLEEGQKVEFEVGEGRRGAEARNVKVIGGVKTAERRSNKRTHRSR